MKGLHTVARRAFLTRIKNDPAFIALIPKANIFGQSPPAVPPWPFSVIGAPQVLPIRAACLDGGTVNIKFSALAQPRKQGGVVIETAEDHAGRIGAAFESAIDSRGETITVDGKAARITYQIADIVLRRDPVEADAYQYSATVRIRIIAE